MKKYIILIVAVVGIIYLTDRAKAPVVHPECETFSRSQICTEQYIPVCATTASGQTTYSNICKACTGTEKESITELRDGECQ